MSILIDTRLIAPPRSITVAVAGISEVILLYNRIEVHRSTTTIGGVYTEITTAATRPVLLPGVVTYNFVDPTGADTSFYKVRFRNATSGAVSGFSEAFAGTGDTAFDVLSVEDLKSTFLAGIPLTTPEGEPFSPGMFEFYIKSAVTYVEGMIDVPLRPLTTTDEEHDLIRQDFYKYMAFQLDNKPVISVTEVRMVLPGQATEVVFPTDWYQLMEHSGQLHIIPGAGNIATVALGISGQWLTIVNRLADFVPLIFKITYTSGWARGQIPYDIREAVGMAAALGPLHVAGDLLLGAGIANTSLSLDGLHQSVGTTASPANSGFGTRVRTYREHLKELLAHLRLKYRGIRMVIA